MTICPASVPVSVEFWPDASSASAKSVLATGHAEHRREQLVGVLDLRDVLALPVERRGRDDEDRAVDEQREHQRDGRIDRRELDRLAPCRSAVRSYLRVCTIDECRYRLCGITVAPRMPIAT